MVGVQVEKLHQRADGRRARVRVEVLELVDHDVEQLATVKLAK